ncbi:MAG: precorrin-2 C(20)-methyltransferase [Rhodospirillales bacterium]
MAGSPKKGTLYGLGVGPGDPELVTLKALRILRQAPVIAYPAPEAGDSLARSIVAPHLPGGQTEIAIRMKLEAARFPAADVYDRAAGEIAGHLGAGRDVAALCQGDPFLYGSFMYLFGRLARDWNVVVVPGVSSLTASAAALGAPQAARDDPHAVQPAPQPEAVREARVKECDAAAIMKLGRHFAKVRRVLKRLGLEDRARYVEHASMANQRVRALAEIGDGEVPYFAMLLVHKRGEVWRVG